MLFRYFKDTLHHMLRSAKFKLIALWESLCWCEKYYCMSVKMCYFCEFHRFNQLKEWKQIMSVTKIQFKMGPLVSFLLYVKTTLVHILCVKSFFHPSVIHKSVLRGSINKTQKKALLRKWADARTRLNMIFFLKQPLSKEKL